MMQSEASRLPAGRARAATAPRGQIFPTAGYWFLGFLATSLLAFWPVYFAVLPYGPELLVHLHVFGVVAWVAMLISQPFLVARGKFALHGQLGRLSYVLVPYIAVTSLLLAHSRFQRMTPEGFARDGHSLYLPVVAVVLFVTSYALAIRYRRKALLHARYMIGTVFALFDPVVARLLLFYSPLPPGPVLYPAIGFGLADLGLLALLIADRGRKGSQAFLGLLPIFVIGHLGWFTIAQTQPWFAVARWFTDLPLT